MGWKDLSELTPTLTEAELRAEKTKRLIGLFLGPGLFVLMLVAPPLPHVTGVRSRSEPWSRAARCFPCSAFS